MMGLMKWVKNLDPAKKDAIMTGLVALGSLLGYGNRAMVVAALLEAVPGRLDALGRAKDKIEALTDMQDEGLDAGTLKMEERASLEMTVEEWQALDDWKDLQGYATRKLKKLARKVH